MKILIVDDLEQMRRMTKDVFCHILQRRPDLEFFEATDGLEALKILASDSIDVLLTDWNMPIMSGYALLHQIPRLFLKKKPCIIIISAEPLTARDIVVDSLTIDGIIVKPCHLLKMSEVITSALTQKQLI